MFHQIVENIIMVIEDGWFGIKIHPHSSSRDKPLPLPINDSLLLLLTILEIWSTFYQTMERIESHSWEQKERKIWEISKLRFSNINPPKFVHLFIHWEMTSPQWWPRVWIEVLRHPLDSNWTIAQFLASLSARWLLSLFCARWLDMQFDSWPYRVRATLNAQDMNRCIDYFSPITGK